MNAFAWALALFVLIHVGISATGARRALVGGVGEGPYRAVFSLVSLGLLIWQIQGFAAMRADPFDPLNEPLWSPPAWLRWPAIALSLLGVTLLASHIDFGTALPTAPVLTGPGIVDASNIEATIAGVEAGAR